MNLPLVPVRVPIEVDTSPAPEIEVIREIGYLSAQEAAGLDGVSLFFREDDEVLRKVIGRQMLADIMDLRLPCTRERCKPEN